MPRKIRDVINRSSIHRRKTNSVIFKLAYFEFRSRNLRNRVIINYECRGWSTSPSQHPIEMKFPTAFDASKHRSEVTTRQESYAKTGNLLRPERFSFAQIWIQDFFELSLKFFSNFSWTWSGYERSILLQLASFQKGQILRRLALICGIERHQWKSPSNVGWHKILQFLIES